MISYMEYQSPLGVLTLAANGKGVCGLYFEQHKYFSRAADWRHDRDDRHLGLAARQLDQYFAGRRREFELPLDLDGTDFQKSVWDELRTIPFGRTATYAAHAGKIGSPRAVRAVGTAIGRNPVSIIVPCHRVLASSGALAGYAGGLERKRYLLALEGIEPKA